VTVSPVSLEEIHHGAVHACFTADRFKGRHLRKMHNFWHNKDVKCQMSNVTDLFKEFFQKNTSTSQRKTNLALWLNSRCFNGQLQFLDQRHNEMRALDW